MARKIASIHETTKAFTPEVVTANSGTASTTFAGGNDSRITGAAQKASNLSDLASAATARTNLGLGTAATTDATAYATAAHGHRMPQAITGMRRTGAAFTIVDDDASTAVLTKLLPIANQYGVPFVESVISDTIGGAGVMTAAQLLNLQAVGCEIASHGKTHAVIDGTMTDAQALIEIRESQAALRALGLDVSTMVWPYGSSTDHARRVASQHYTAGVGTDAILNGSPIRTYQLGRNPFPVAGWTLGQYTALVDQAIIEGAWLVFMTHVSTQTAEDDTMLGQVISYVQAQSVPVVTVRDGIADYGNYIDLDDQSRYWGRNGVNNIVSYDYRPVNPTTGVETFGFDTLPADIPSDKTWYGRIATVAERAKGPTGAVGVLTAQRAGTGYGCETFRSDQRVWVREELGTGLGWYSWREALTGLPRVSYTMAARTVNAQSTSDVTVYDDTLGGNCTYAAAPSGTLEAGIMWSVWSHGDGACIIRLSNPTAAAVNLSERVWTVRGTL